MSDIRQAEEFLTQFGPDLEELLGDVELVCRAVKKQLAGGVIDDIYDRKSSTDGKSNFKEPGKIIIKLRDQGNEPGIPSFLALSDIVGLTVVIRYPAQVKPVIAEIRKALLDLPGNKRIQSDEPEPKDRDGYYATHFSCRRLKGGYEFKCEVQVKTMLHNAMSAKMHDLTYKPTGILDPRLKSLMASIASTIESLEQQSQLVHDSIKANWNVEEETRRAARDELFNKMLRFLWRDQSDAEISQLQEAVKGLQAAAKASSGGLTSVPTDDLISQGNALAKRISSACQRDRQNLRHGWVVAARLASLFPHGSMVKFVMGHAEEWLKIAPKLLSEGTIQEAEMTAIPLVFYVIGDIERAIDYSDRLLNEPTCKVLTKNSIAHIVFNKATFVVEREYHSPTKHIANRKTLRNELEQILNSEPVSDLEADSAILDTKGFLKITFAENAEEVRKGIYECFEARALAKSDEAEISNAYADLNLRLGWRRYVQLEGQNHST